MHPKLVIMTLLYQYLITYIYMICKIIPLNIDYRIILCSSSFCIFKMSLCFLLSCIVFDEKIIIQTFSWLLSKIFYLQLYEVYMPRCVFIFIYPVWSILSLLDLWFVVFC